MTNGISRENGKSHVPGDLDPDPSSSDSLSKNLIRRNISIPVNRSKIKAIRIKIVGNTRKMTHQTHRQDIMIRPKTMITDAKDVKIRAIGKWI